jgi:hypothetical protein
VWTLKIWWSPQPPAANFSWRNTKVRNGTKLSEVERNGKNKNIMQK